MDSTASAFPNGTVRLSGYADSLRLDPELEVDDGYAIPHALVLDHTLSYRARGIAILLYMRPPGYACRISDLCGRGGKRHGTGRAAVMTALSELADGGWIDPLYVKGRIPPELRMAVLRRDGYRCVACNTDEDLAADHVVPESRGGTTTFGNLQTMCRSCNSRKGARA